MKFSTAILASLAASIVSAAPVQKRDVNIPDWVKGFWGTTYTPFDASHNCRTPDQIKEDISALSGHFKVLRLYSDDCGVIQYAAENFDGQLMLAVNDISSAETISNDLGAITYSIEAAGKKVNDVVHTVFVGNELIYNNWYSASDVANFISQAKQAWPDYTGEWSTGETASSYYGNPDLCAAVDTVYLNNHPWFDNQNIDTAGEYVLGHIQAVAAFCSEHGHNVSVKTSETGWPWKGDSNGPAVASPQNQETAVRNIVNAAGDACIVFSAYNELWKDGTLNGGVEQNWGVLGNAPSEQ
ncbi:unnamed protein product [Ambrosiozyma monospora]|uniref:Unnamed protein product n=1 Tax=Ambrosiozyma monospora TaxID=43982 RepID=A0A9W7DFV1_AMBMO|nr:unnamed protein product [Ambrosiozyma monospora]